MSPSLPSRLVHKFLPRLLLSPSLSGGAPPAAPLRIAFPPSLHLSPSVHFPLGNLNFIQGHLPRRRSCNRRGEIFNHSTPCSNVHSALLPLTLSPTFMTTKSFATKFRFVGRSVSVSQLILLFHIPCKVFAGHIYGFSGY